MIHIQLKSINNVPLEEGYSIIKRLCEDKIKLSVEDIEFILNLDEKELVAIFLPEYSLFDQQDFLLIEKFINDNLEIDNLDFLSDLIYFATDFGLDINYSCLLSLLIVKETDEDFVVLACLNYIHDNIKLSYIEELFCNLNYIRDNRIYHQNEQLLASLILFRITHNANYLDFLIELVNFDETNKEFLNNILKLETYNPKYFQIEDFKRKIGI